MKFGSYFLFFFYRFWDISDIIYIKELIFAVSNEFLELSTKISSIEKKNPLIFSSLFTLVEYAAKIYSSHKAFLQSGISSVVEP